MAADGDDPLGDDSFLEGFDLDVAVAQEQQKRQLYSPEYSSSGFAYGSSVASSVAVKRPRVAGPPETTIPLQPSFPVADLEKTLQHYFGYSAFRQGQADVIRAVLQKRDSTVFWATGAGKSLCYQIPPLHTNQVALVISPLISLMQDQVHKLNGLSSEALATFLGSAQSNAAEEVAAMRGEYRVVYITPEKLCSAGFLDSLNSSTMRQRLCVIAVDESHCVSEWGHDFRPEFRRIGDVLRGQPSLADVPIVALTATAVPRVQQDIIQSLQLKSPFVARRSFDRPNLQLTVFRKHKGNAMEDAMDPLVQQLLDAEAKGRLSSQSTIVYAPTRNEVDEVTSYLQSRLAAGSSAGVLVEPYHAGLPTEARARAHTNFLTGQSPVIVATVAFGMGIDKTDTRRIIHYGPPKTLEEYYQQVGRAGRDGLTAECIMYTKDGDFSRYQSDFYVGGLTEQAKKARLDSLDQLRNYAVTTHICRRKMLLDFFEETPSFGERCGTCDNCQSIKRYGSDNMERDLGNEGARVLLYAVRVTHHQGLTVILDVVGGGRSVEDYRFRSGYDQSRVEKAIQKLRDGVKKKRTKEFYRELVPSLVRKGFMRESRKSATVNGSFKRNWLTYDLTPHGIRALDDPSVPIVLPVPDSVRETERKEEAMRKEAVAQLEKNGILLDRIPAEEVERGNGKVLQAYKTWLGYLGRLRQRGREDRAKQLEDLAAKLDQWRITTAIKYRMAPGSVLSEDLVVSVAYTVASLRPGMKLGENELVAAGVRTREVDSLVRLLSDWIDEFQPKPSVEAYVPKEENDSSMVFAPGVVRPARRWHHAKANVKKGKTFWESSYWRFMAGNSPQTIAMSPENGRPIQVDTVVGHILEALQQGDPVDLCRLSQYSTPPGKNEWERLEEASRAMDMDVCGDPATSGRNGETFRMGDFLRPIVGDAVVDAHFSARKECDKVMFSRWCQHLKWYQALKRAGIKPNFA